MLIRCWWKVVTKALLSSALKGAVNKGTAFGYFWWYCLWRHLSCVHLRELFIKAPLLLRVFKGVVYKATTLCAFKGVVYKGTTLVCIQGSCLYRQYPFVHLRDLLIQALVVYAFKGFFLIQRHFACVHLRELIIKALLLCEFKGIVYKVTTPVNLGGLFINALLLCEFRGIVYGGTTLVCI